MKINIPETGQKRIVIVGAGFAGLKLAEQLARSDYQVVLLDKNNFHQFQPLFYQVAMSGLEPSSIAFPLRKLFRRRKNVFIRIAEVEEIKLEEKIIHTSLGHAWYDYLVLAIGADTNFFGNDHIAERAIPMKSVSEALYLRNRILTDYEQALSTPDYDERQGLLDIVIVGGGPTGVEVAGALAEMKKYILPKEYRELDLSEVDIHLVEGSSRLLAGMSEKSGEEAKRFLEQLGVEVKLNSFVTDYDGEWVKMQDGTTIQSKKVIWAAGIIGNTISGLPQTALVRGNRIQVDRFNRVIDVPDVFALGDIAYMEEPSFPQGHPQVAQTAIQQAKNLGQNLKKSETGTNWRAFSYQDKGSMATVGRHRAVVDLPNTHFKGVFAWLVWLFVHLFALMGTKNKVFVFINWLWNYLTYDQSLRLIIRPFRRATSAQESPLKS
jgi:NADH dehydrogenase